MVSHRSGQGLVGSRGEPSECARQEAGRTLTLLPALHATESNSLRANRSHTATHKRKNLPFLAGGGSFVSCLQGGEQFVCELDFHVSAGYGSSDYVILSDVLIQALHDFISAKEKLGKKITLHYRNREGSRASYNIYRSPVVITVFGGKLRCAPATFVNNDDGVVLCGGHNFTLTQTSYPFEEFLGIS